MIAENNPVKNSRRFIIPPLFFEPYPQHEAKQAYRDCPLRVVNPVHSKSISLAATAATKISGKAINVSLMMNETRIPSPEAVLSCNSLDYHHLQPLLLAALSIALTLPLETATSPSLSPPNVLDAGTPIKNTPTASPVAA